MASCDFITTEDYDGAILGMDTSMTLRENGTTNIYKACLYIWEPAIYNLLESSGRDFAPEASF